MKFYTLSLSRNCLLVVLGGGSGGGVVVSASPCPAPKVDGEPVTAKEQLAPDEGSESREGGGPKGTLKVGDGGEVRVSNSSSGSNHISSNPTGNHGTNATAYANSTLPSPLTAGSPKGSPPSP